MKTVKIAEIRNHRGGTLDLPRFDENGAVISEPIPGPDGTALRDSAGKILTQVISGPGTILDALDYLTITFPREKLTMEHVGHLTRLVRQIAECRESGCADLQFEDAEYSWLMGVLKDDHVGVKLFGVDIESVINALESKGGERG